MQYELMALLGRIHGCVTIVGDPDQSSKNMSIRGFLINYHGILTQFMVGDPQVG